MPDSKSDPTKDPEFQKVIRHFVTTPPKPHSEMKVGKRMAKTNQKASPPPQRHICIELFEELRLLLKQPGVPRSGHDSFLQIIQHLDKCLRVKFAYETAARTGKAILILEPSDTFMRFMSAFRAYDWPLVSILEHEICSSTAETRASSA
jgi:hypothetical protein